MPPRAEGPRDRADHPFGAPGEPRRASARFAPGAATRRLTGVPTPVGPLGPDEIDPHDPDFWDWETPAASSRTRSTAWIRATVWVVVAAFALLVIASFFR